ncbi:hypothetical protein U1839_18740 [Sphingomonas sp. RT2P30]|uniref:hypothetical protein n=1 Tax=Parasphingomonas halimpatiens TaxID=3096162 RepID=UPI002FCC396D
MVKRSNPFFELDGERDEPPARRLYARVDRSDGQWMLLEAVNADWMDRFLGEGAGPDLWREVGPEAPVSILQLRLDDWFRLCDRTNQDPEQGLRWRRWVELVIEDRGVEIVQYLNLFAGPRTIRVDKTMTADQATQQGFSRLMNLTPYVSTQAEIEAVLPSKSQRIEWVAVYDVGQGSASALLDEYGAPSMYADLGGGVVGHLTTFPADFKRLCLTRSPTIVLSHWDWDHWSSAARFPAAQTMTWIAPNQTFGIVHGVFAALVVANGRLMIWPSCLPSAHSGQIAILKCKGNDRNNSGLAVSVDGPDGEPPILLPGDASYWNVPTGQGVHTSVVAPHHGAAMGATMPSDAGSMHGRVAYSYGANNQWKHPLPITMTRHDAAGWPHDVLPATDRDIHTAHRAASPALGHIGLSWKGGTPPSPPCGGRLCDQAIVQS